MPATATARIVVAVLSAGLLVAASVLTYRLTLELRTLQQISTDVAEIQDVKYGLFDAEAWVEQISAILSRRIDTFEVTETNRPQIKRNIEVVLDRLLKEIEQVLRRRNAQGDSWVDRLQGSLRQGVQDWLVDFDELRARVPLYADAVIDELDRPQRRAEIKAALLAAIDNAAAATFTRIDRSALTRIEHAYGCEVGVDCLPQLHEDAARLRARSLRNALWVLGLVVALFALSLLIGAGDRHEAQRWESVASPRDETSLGQQALPVETMVMLTMATLVLLAAGVMTPMIEVEARIDELRLSLLGEPVVFAEQVLYFQSKSILDVVRILAATGAADMIVVAALVTLFSLVFPSAKVIAGFVYYANVWGLRGNTMVSFFALRSSKWSMADVLVVAILMAYIGFDGLIASQLSELAGGAGKVDVVTTNGTALQLGFFMFLAFVMASLVLSSMLEARVGRTES